MSDALQPGVKGEISLVVGQEHTAQHLGSGAVRVLATPQMVLLMERASVAAVDHLLPNGYCTVGAHLDVRHLAPTPEGFEVRAIAELVEIDGRRLTFRIQVFEAPFGADQLVGDGIHRRAIMNLQRFGDSVAQKAAEAS
jgi:fluoroacetyl-CoA thioesterase